MKDLLGVFRSTLNHVFRVPVQEGRPHPEEWPRALRWIALLAMVMVGALAVLTAFGTQFRAIGNLVSIDNFMIYPEWAIGPMLWVGVFILTLLFSATLRTHWAITLVVWIGIAPQLLVMASAGGTLGLGLASGAAIALAIMPWVVRRRPWHVAEVAVVWALMQVVVLVPLWRSPAQSLGMDARTLSLLNMQLAMNALAIPALAAAGYAAVELLDTSAQWLTHDLRQLGTRAPMTRWLLVAVLATGVWRAWTIAADFGNGGVSNQLATHLTSLLIIGMTVGLCLLAWARSKQIAQDRRAVWPVGRPAILAELWNPWTFAAGVSLMVLLVPHSLFNALAAILAATGAPSPLASAARAITEVLRSSIARNVSRLLFAVAVYVIAWRRASAGLLLLGSALVALWGIPIVDQLVAGRLTVWNLPSIMMTISVLALLWLVWSALRRRLHNGVLLGVWVIWLLPQVYEFREVISDPTALAGLLSPVALVLLGLVWRLVTDGAFLRGDSTSLPRPARVLLMLANTSLGMMVLAVTALAGGTQPFTSLEEWAMLGEDMIGGPLMLAAMLSPLLISFWTARIDDDRPRVPVPEGMRLPMPAAAAGTSGASWPAPPMPPALPGPRAGAIPEPESDATTVRPAGLAGRPTGSSPLPLDRQMGGQAASGPTPFGGPQT